MWEAQIERLDRHCDFRFPALEELILNTALATSGASPKDEITDTIEMFSYAPRLRKLYTRQISHSDLNLPWNQIAHFETKHHTLEQCSVALQLMPHWFFHVFDIYANDFPEPVRHAHIEHLHILGDEHKLRSSSFSTLPRLRTLTVEGTRAFDAKTFDAFLKRSSPPLHRRVVDPGHSTSTAFEPSPTFAALPLATLEIWRPQDTFLADLFAVFASDSRFLPCLENLWLQDCRDVDGQAKISDIIRTRRPGDSGEAGASRRALSPAGCRHPCPETFPPAAADVSRFPPDGLHVFRELQKGGMKIYIGVGRVGHSII